MEYDDIRTQVRSYRRHLANEYEAKKTVVQFETLLAKAETKAVSAAEGKGHIDGKNADTRKAQRATAIENDDLCKKARAKVEVKREDAEMATIERKAQEQLLNLTKAWLYSQSGVAR